MGEIGTIDVFGLRKADGVQDGDTLLLIRPNEDGTQQCYRVEGNDFRGSDAYEVAKKNGYTGTRAEWEEQIRRVSNVDIGFDSETGELVITY